MKRTLWIGSVVLASAGCTLPPERVPPRPLPDEVQPVPYAELLTRARQQASAAVDASYVDRWADLEELARGLEQTSRYLVKATDVPAKHRDTLVSRSRDVGKAAGALGEAAKAQDAKKAHAALDGLLQHIRELRLED